MVLGVDWMRQFSPVVMDFNAMTVSFQWKWQNITLKGGQKNPGLKAISGEKLQKIAEKDPYMTGDVNAYFRRT